MNQDVANKLVTTTPAKRWADPTEIGEVRTRLTEDQGGSTQMLALH